MDASSQTRRVHRGGQPLKGGVRRQPFTVRLLPEFAAQIRAEAAEMGLPAGDYLAMLVHQARGIDVPEYITEQISSATAQEALVS